jgi:hypothetical protein
MTTFGELRGEHLNAMVHPFVQSYRGLTVHIHDDKFAHASLGIASMVDLLVFFIATVGAKREAATR